MQTDIHIVAENMSNVDVVEEVAYEQVKPLNLAKKQTKGIKKILKIISNVIFGIVIVAVALMAFFMIRSRIAGTPPMVFGHYIFIVLSGSMEPEFSTGSIVFVKPADPQDIMVGDIVTFSGFAGSRQLTSHRVIEIINDENQGLFYVTKGDANNAKDPDPISAENMVGRVSGSAPLLGYLMSFVQTKQGLTLFILVPASLLIGYEVYGFLKHREEKKQRKVEEDNEPQI